MKCPLLTMVQYHREGYLPDGGAACIEKECAWWEPKIGKCSVLRMWIALQDIHEVLHDISKDMPHWRQSRK